MTNNKKHSSSSKRWLERQHADAYTQKAKADGYRSRACYKLMEIQQKDTILNKGGTVIDLGAAPGGWSQFAAKIVGSSGKVFAVDILPIDPLQGVDILQGDFLEMDTVDQLKKLVDNRSVDLVISDMAPNLTGISSVDQPKAFELAELAYDFALEMLSPHGNFVVKVFQGEGFEKFVKDMRSNFSKVVIRKPKASRRESREVYLLGLNLEKR